MVLKQEPDYVRALGNMGNALMAHGRLKLQMLRLLPEALGPAAAAGEPLSAEAAAAEAARERLEGEAVNLLVLAGGSLVLGGWANERHSALWCGLAELRWRRAAVPLALACWGHSALHSACAAAAGRKYKRVLELDENQPRAMVNWGRCIGLRADRDRAAGTRALPAFLLRAACLRESGEDLPCGPMASFCMDPCHASNCCM